MNKVKLILISPANLIRFNPIKDNIIILISILVFLQFSCNNFKRDSTATAGKFKVDNQGVVIDYEDTKVGDITLLFVHGWNIDKNYWSNQTNFFSKKYRVVVIDLPGHGKSGKNRENWTVEEYGKDVTAILTRLELHNVILIGHSMSGAIVVESALKNPDRVIGIVGIDNFSDFGKEVSSEEKDDMQEAYKALRINYKETVLQYANQSLFSPSTNNTIRKRVIRDFVNADPTIAVEILEQNEKYPIDVNLKSLGKTIFLLNSNYYSTDTSGFKKDNIPYEILYVGPTGHYPMIENPDTFNISLERVILKIAETNDNQE